MQNEINDVAPDIDDYLIAHQIEDGYVKMEHTVQVVHVLHILTQTTILTQIL